jgi:type IV pilus assembly protein PilZ
MRSKLNLHFEIHIKSIAELEEHYLPFIRGGGLFVATNEEVNLNETVSVELHLFDKNEKIVMHGNVVLISPAYALDKLPAGIGIQFTPSDAKLIKDRVAGYLS